MELLPMLMESITNILKTLRYNKAIQIALILLIIIFFVFTIVSFDLAEAKDFIRANRRQAAFISIGIYFLLSFSLIPTSPLTLFLAVFMGPIETVAVAATGNILAALLGYQIGATVGDIFDFEAHMEDLPFNLGELPISSPLLLMSGRLLPLGRGGFSMVCGAYQVIFGKYLWTSILMFIVNASVLAFTGASLLRLFERLIP